MAVQSEYRVVDDVAAESEALLNRLRRQIGSDPDRWSDFLLNVVGAWSLVEEEVDGEEYRYFIGGEAFNWKRLAERLIAGIAVDIKDAYLLDSMQEWLHSDDVFGGFEENEFRRALGIDKWRGHLNYFYGVYLERCLFTVVQHRIHRRRFARGMSPGDDAADDAFLGLYNEDEATLWRSFVEESDCVGDQSSGNGSVDVSRSLSVDDEFTYWLFKRRIGSTNRPQVAYEIQQGLEMVALIEDADARRHRMLRNDHDGELLEFGVVNKKRVVRR